MARARNGVARADLRVAAVLVVAMAVVGALLLTAAAVWWIWLRPSTALTAPEGGARTCGPAGAPPESLKMFATQIITNSGDDSVEITAVTFPTTSGAEVKDWFLVGLDEYMYATGASPDIPPAPAGHRNVRPTKRRWQGPTCVPHRR